MVSCITNASTDLTALTATADGSRFWPRELGGRLTIFFGKSFTIFAMCNTAQYLLPPSQELDRGLVYLRVGSVLGVAM